MPTLPPKLLEIDLVGPISRYFHDHGYSIALEVPVYRNRADLVAYTETELIAVELKLTKWQRALRQAGYYQLGADFTYIAMPFNEAFEVHKRRKLLKNEHVGLLAVIMEGHEVRELVKPKPSVKKLGYIEKYIRQFIEGKTINTDFFDLEEE
jgi:hypothetical protein